MVVLALFLCVTAPVAADEVKGRITKVDAKKKEITVTAGKDKKDQVISVDDKAKITCNDKECTLEDLEKNIDKGIGAVVTVEKDKATKIEAKTRKKD